MAGRASRQAEGKLYGYCLDHCSDEPVEEIQESLKELGFSADYIRRKTPSTLDIVFECIDLCCPKLLDSAVTYCTAHCPYVYSTLNNDL